MNAEEIRKRLTDAGLEARVSYDTVFMDKPSPTPIRAHGPLSAWQRALGPTKEEVREAFVATFNEGPEADECDVSIYDFINRLNVRLFPEGG